MPVRLVGCSADLDRELSISTLCPGLGRELTRQSPVFTQHCQLRGSLDLDMQAPDVQYSNVQAGSRAMRWETRAYCSVLVL